MPEGTIDIPPQAFAALSTLRSAFENVLPAGTDFGIGAKQSAGEFLLNELALIVFVPEKLPLDVLPPDQLIPASVTEQGIKFPTDVVQSNPVPVADTSFAAQLRGGVEIGFFDLAEGLPSRGTLGCVVQRRADGARQLLTAAHVAPLGTVMSQPAPGEFQSSEVGTVVNADARPTHDCAVIAPNGLRGTPVADVLEIGPVRGAAAFELFSAATKRGRSTGLTTGLVVAAIPHPGTSAIKRIVLATFPFGGLYCSPGDSGSVVLNGNREVIALLLEMHEVTNDASGNPAASVAHAVPIQAVLDALDVEIAVSPPVITSIQPDTAAGVLANQGVTQIDGLGFDAGSQVTFGGIPALSVIPASPLRLIVTPPAQFGPGVATDVIVTTGLGEQSLPSVSAQFTF